MAFSILVLSVGVLSLGRPPHVISQAEAASARKVLSRVVPQYPELARSMHTDGTVKVLVTVAPDGHCTLARVIGGHRVGESSSRRDSEMEVEQQSRRNQGGR
jgi:hypothetical protein